MFTDTLCLLISFATTLFLLWHVEQRRIISRGLRQPSSDDLLKQTLFKWRRRCILVFLLVLPVQLSRGLLLLFWPNPLVMDLMSALSGPVHYLSFLILVLRITPRGSPDEGIALSPISPQSGDVDVPGNGSPDNDGSNNGEVLLLGSPPENRFAGDDSNRLLESQLARSRAAN
ncbi:uncharacterized protein EI90DRAFT_3018537 [Cantharellus anzutake]|uniref:uncharacterized protein n=1 Tax=Cantharellus anzutake TaxID=1750568 RepID=UPI001902E2CA|nr:uncharacterized protein EI90DRAFT_3018537 [Cantharellus anzutake]KAF8326583.1 hypothetical protein EI90DRAFT_3018537 [Cantharellus anzutake]